MRNGANQGRQGRRPRFSPVLRVEGREEKEQIREHLARKTGVGDRERWVTTRKSGGDRWGEEQEGARNLERRQGAHPGGESIDVVAGYCELLEVDHAGEGESDPVDLIAAEVQLLEEGEACELLREDGKLSLLEV